jgi:4-alpha-glucanotransferase
VVAEHLASPSMLCLLALQDYLSIDEQLRRPTPEEEQINVPADPHHVWNYRMHLTLETLLVATDFNRRLQRMMAAAGRTTAGGSMSKK